MKTSIDSARRQGRQIVAHLPTTLVRQPVEIEMQAVAAANGEVYRRIRVNGLWRWVHGDVETRIRGLRSGGRLKVHTCTPVRSPKLIRELERLRRSK